MQRESERLSGDCNQDSQERILRRVSLSTAQMNPDTDFSMSENLIDICFLAVTLAIAVTRSPANIQNYVKECYISNSHFHKDDHSLDSRRICS